MMQISRKDKEKIIESIKNGRIDAADISFPNLIDDIIMKMNRKGLIKDLTK
ncbi:hypothetical protein SAMN02745135_02486, partial [Caloranaerobacter azorensis DSM 13643]